MTRAQRADCAAWSKQLYILELCAGHGSMSLISSTILHCPRATVDNEPSWAPNICKDIMEWTEADYEALRQMFPGRQPVVFASPPCILYSQANTTGGVTEEDLRRADALVRKVCAVWFEGFIRFGGFVGSQVQRCILYSQANTTGGVTGEDLVRADALVRKVCCVDSGGGVSFEFRVLFGLSLRMHPVFTGKHHRGGHRGGSAASGCTRPQGALCGFMV